MVQTGGGMGMAVAAALVVVLLPWLLRAALACLVWRPYAVAPAFARQGIRGPPYWFFVGNAGEATAMLEAASGEALDRSSHDIVPRVMPHLRAWTSLYGKVFLSWSGSTPALCVGSYAMARRVLSDKAGLYDKKDPGPAVVALLGNGMFFVEGEDWARRCRVVHPAFAMDKLKAMAGAVAACAGEAIRSWEAAAAVGGEVTVEVVQKFTELTTDVISRTVFGSNYRQGKEVFMARRELQFIAFKSINSEHVPGMQYAPTKSNVRRWRLERKVRGALMDIIDERLAAAKEGAGGHGGDLIDLMLEANAAGEGSESVMTMSEIIDECKAFFFAGHESTTHLLTWAMFLLGTHPEWQRRLREEVLRECGGAETPIHGDTLNKLKLVTMMLYETLRLYGAATLINLRATADADLCGVVVPKGTLLLIPIPMLHRDEEAWGADAGEFNPLRFKDGAGGAAALPGALLSFSVGPRSCIGQDLAMMEAKAVLAVVLRRFAFEVASEYVHAPADVLTLQPSQGLPVLLKLLDP